MVSSTSKKKSYGFPNDDAVEKVSLGSWLIIEHKMFDSAYNGWEANGF